MSALKNLLSCSRQLDSFEEGLETFPLCSSDDSDKTMDACLEEQGSLVLSGEMETTKESSERCVHLT
jgi:hypothetical protein